MPLQKPEPPKVAVWRKDHSLDTKKSPPLVNHKSKRGAETNVHGKLSNPHTLVCF